MTHLHPSSQSWALAGPSAIWRSQVRSKTRYLGSIWWWGCLSTPSLAPWNNHLCHLRHSFPPTSAWTTTTSRSPLCTWRQLRGSGSLTTRATKSLQVCCCCTCNARPPSSLWLATLTLWAILSLPPARPSLPSPQQSQHLSVRSITYEFFSESLNHAGSHVLWTFSVGSPLYTQHIAVLSSGSQQRGGLACQRAPGTILGLHSLGYTCAWSDDA